MAGVASARIANRHALHSVYYSAAKKKVLPPKEATTQLRNDLMRCNCAIKIEVEHVRMQQTMSVYARAAEIKKNTMKQGLFYRRYFGEHPFLRRNVHTLCSKTCIDCASSTHIGPLKKFCTASAIQPAWTAKIDQKKHESAPGDSR
jgi:hypothetical protein